MTQINSSGINECSMECCYYSISPLGLHRGSAQQFGNAIAKDAGLMISSEDLTKAQSELLGEELEGVAVMNTTGSLEPNTTSEPDNQDQSRI